MEDIVGAKKSKSAFYRTFILPLTLEGEELEFNIHTLVSASSFSDSANIELKKIKVMVRNMWNSVVEMQVRLIVPFKHLRCSDQILTVAPRNVLLLPEKRKFPRIK